MCTKQQKTCALQSGIHFLTLIAVVFVLRLVIPPDTMRKKVSVVNTETSVCIGTSHATNSAGFKCARSQCSIS
jgi:hypothetical protein